MKKVVIITLCLFVFCVIGISTIGVMAINKEEYKYKSHINKKVAINGDTLTVVDYNMYGGTCKLSNGVEMSEELINIICIKPDLERRMRGE